MTDDEDPGLQLAVPFTVVASAGGPYDDDAFCAGFTIGALHAGLAALAATSSPAEFYQPIRTDLVHQADLVAMHHGWTTTHEGESPGAEGWTVLTLHPPTGDGL